MCVCVCVKNLTHPLTRTHTYAGVGGIAIDSKAGEVLVVQERFNPAVGKFTWKFPGGMIDAGVCVCVCVCMFVCV